MAKRAVSTDVILSGGNKGRFTKEAIEQRKAAEKASLTGYPISEFPETKSDPVAHAEYKRVIQLLNAVGKNDALFEDVMNEYSQLASEISAMRSFRKRIEADTSLTSIERYTQMMRTDRQINQKCQRRFLIEKESGFTVMSSKAMFAPKTESKTDLLAEALSDAD